MILTGGDPFHPSCFEYSLMLAEVLKKDGVIVEADSSLAIEEIRKLEKIADANFDKLYVSCDSHEVAIHNGQRGRGKETLRAIDFIQGKKDIHIICCLTKANYHQVEEIRNYFQSRGMQVSFNIAFIPEGTWQYNVFSCETLGEDDKAVLAESLHQDGILSGSQPLQQYHALQAKMFFGIEDPCNPVLVPCCGMGKDYIVLEQAGKVKACFHHDNWVGSIEDPLDLSNDLTNGKANCQRPCFGKHCVSLFEIASFWTKEEE